MSRDPKKLRAFIEADNLVVDVYRATKNLPVEERFGLQAQVRRAAVSVAANIVEGCARPSTAEYVRFLWIAYSSAKEASYLLELCTRLSFIDVASVAGILKRYEAVQGALFNAAVALDASS